MRPGHLENVAVRRRPHGLREVADVEAAGPERPLLEHRERREADAERDRRRRRRAERAVVIPPRRPVRAAPPPRAEDRLRGARLVRRAPCLGEPLGEPVLVRDPPDRLGERRGIARPRRAGRRRRRSRSSRAAGVSAVITGRAAGEALEHLVRDDAGRLRARAEDAERAAGAAGTPSAAPDTGSTDVLDVRPAGRRGAARAGRRRRRGTGPPGGAPPRRGSSPARGGGSACRRRARGTARAAASRAGRARSSAPTSATSTRSSGRPKARRKNDGVRLRVRDDEVGASGRRRRSTIRRIRAAGDHGRNRCAIADERVVERDERVEHDRPAPGDASRGRQVEVTGIADEDDVRLALLVARESTAPPSRTRDICRSPSDQLLPPPDLPVPLDDLDAGAAEAGHDLRVPRRRRGRTSRSRGPSRTDRSAEDLVDEPRARDRPAPAAARRCWLVTSSESNPSERNWIPTTTSRTPSRRSGRRPIASPRQLDDREVDEDRGRRRLESTSPSPPNRWSGRCR